MEIKYIDNDKQNGIDIDWDFIAKEYKKLKCPKGFFDLTQTDIKNSNWIIAMSPRASSGKTSNALLYGLLCYKNYGVKTALIRSRDYMIQKKNIGDVFNVILEFGYVSKIFGEKWNSITYFGGKWTLCRVNENGEIEEKDTQEFCRAFSVQSYANYKSSVNDYYFDFIVFDEMIAEFYAEDEFSHLCDLLFSLGRMRISPRVICLSNTVDKHSQYFRELCIADDIKNMEFGDSKIITSPLGTRVNVLLLKTGEQQKKLRDLQIKHLFGFDNPKVQALTGSCTWAIKNYPKLEKEDFEEIEKLPIRILTFNNQNVLISLCRNETKGTFVYVRKYTGTPQKDIPLYTLDSIKESFERYGLGHTKTDKYLFSLMDRNKWYYATNEDGYLVERYVKDFKSR